MTASNPNPADSGAAASRDAARTARRLTDGTLPRTTPTPNDRAAPPPGRTPEGAGTAAAPGPAGSDLAGTGTGTASGPAGTGTASGPEIGRAHV